MVVAAVSELVEKESFMKDEVSLPAGHKAVTLLVDYCYTQMIGPFTGNQQVKSFYITVHRIFRRVFESRGGVYKVPIVVAYKVPIVLVGLIRDWLLYKVLIEVDFSLIVC